MGAAYYYYAAAQLQKKEGQTDRAIKSLEKAVAADPNTLFLRHELALLHVMQRNQKGALAVVQEILEIDGAHLDSLMLSGRIHQSMKQMDQAKAAYEKILEIDLTDNEKAALKDTANKVKAVVEETGL